MPSRQLTPDEVEKLLRPLLQEVRTQLTSLSSGDEQLLLALRQRLAEELSYDETGKTMQPRQLKAVKRALHGQAAQIPIGELWYSTDRNEWDRALERYWTKVQPRNIELERALETLELNRIRRMDAKSWYDFLLNEYFRWKYTAPNRYKTTTTTLKKDTDSRGLLALDDIRQELLGLNPANTEEGLKIADRIPGLGTAGASGLLARCIPAFSPPSTSRSQGST